MSADPFIEGLILDAFTRQSDRDKQFQYLEPLTALGLSTRFWAKVRKTPYCWEWTGAKVSKGYGTIINARKQCAAHKLAYELEHGERVPEGMTIDHKCRNKACVRAAHFDVVTARVNTQRRWDYYRSEVKPGITHCPHGHELTPENTYITPRNESKRCRLCIRLAGRKHDAKRGWRR